MAIGHYVKFLKAQNLIGWGSLEDRGTSWICLRHIRRVLGVSITMRNLVMIDTVILIIWMFHYHYHWRIWLKNAYSCSTFCTAVEVVDVITCDKVSGDWLRDIDSVGGWKWRFPID